MSLARATAAERPPAAVAEPARPVPPTPLGSRVVAGATWTALSSVGVQVLTLARTIILARLLTKDQFGLAGLALTVLAAGAVLTNLGLQASLIAKPAADARARRRQLDTVFTVELARGALLAAFVIALAKPAAAFYGDDRVAAILVVLALVPLLQGLTNVGMVTYSADVKMLRPAVLELCTAAAATVAALVFAIVTRSAFAVVLSQVAATALSVALSYRLHPHRPRLAFDRGAFLQAWAFGKYVFVIGLLVFVTTVGDNIAVGRFLGAAELAGYLVAYSLANLPQTFVSKVLGSVLFPSFAEAGRGDADALRARVRRALVAGAGLMTVITAPMVVVSTFLLTLLFGPAFASATAVLQVLIVVGLCRGLIQVVSPLVMGLARPDLEARSKVLEAAVFLALVVPLTLSLGAVGAAAAAAVTYVTALVVRMRYASRLVPGAFARPLALVAAPLAAGAGAIAVGAAVVASLPAGTPDWSGLLAAGCATSLAAFGGLVALSPAFRREVQGVARRVRDRHAAR